MNQITQEFAKTTVKPYLDDDSWLLIANYLYRPASTCMPIANQKTDLVPSADLINLGKVDKRMWALFAPLVWSSVEICKRYLCASQ